VYELRARIEDGLAEHEEDGLDGHEAYAGGGGPAY
jgi:hypothetical protein